MSYVLPENILAQAGVQFKTPGVVTEHTYIKRVF